MVTQGQIKVLAIGEPISGLSFGHKLAYWKRIGQASGTVYWHHAVTAQGDPLRCLFTSLLQGGPKSHRGLRHRDARVSSQRGMGGVTPWPRSIQCMEPVLDLEQAKVGLFSTVCVAESESLPREQTLDSERLLEAMH